MRRVATVLRTVAAEVQEICERYGLPYNSAPLWRQFGTTWLKNLCLAFPGGTLPPEPARA